MESPFKNMYQIYKMISLIPNPLAYVVRPVNEVCYLLTELHEDR